MRPSRGQTFATVPVDGVPIHDVSEREAVEAVAHAADDAREAGKGLSVVTPNMDHLWLLRRDEEFREAYREARLVLRDGKPLGWIARRAGTPFRNGVVPGSALFVTLCAEAPSRGWNVFFLGGARGRAEEAAGILAGRFPGFKAAGVHCPPLGFENDEKLWGDMRRALDEADKGPQGPLDLVFLALGAPKSEKAASRLIAEGAPAAVYLSVGAAFDFVCGKPRRAPAWVRKLALEWLYRLLRDPRRLFKRYVLRDLPLFLELMLRPGGRHKGLGDGEGRAPGRAG